ncbi:tetratricopeptide repeat protein [Carnobacterium sp.]|uniref:tetratricopeptide repeat protein n=1 Tax=Carnobacterium sp. TaxID=48221 RepID=UPI00388D0609
MSYGQMMIDTLQNNQLEEAMNYFEQALKQDTDEELYNLADSLYHLGFLNEVKKINLHLLERYPEDDELRIGLAEIAIEANELDTAMDWLLEVTEDSAVYPQTLLVLADLYQVQGLYEVSEQKLLKAKEILSDEPVIDFALAELHFSMGKYAQAIHSYEELMNQGLSDFSGINLAARCGSSYSALGDLEQAILYLEQSLEEKENVDTLFQLGFSYLQDKQYRRSIETLNKLKDLDPNYTTLYPYLAKGLEEENELDKALEIIKEGLRVDEYNYELFYYGADIAIKLEDEPLAETYYLKAIQLVPENSTVQLAYTNLLLKQERFDETVDWIQKMLVQNEVDPQFYWNLALANEGLEEYSAASTAYQKAYPLLRQNKDFLKSYIYFLREEGERTVIKAVINDYLLLDPTDAEILELLEEINSNY